MSGINSIGHNLVVFQLVLIGCPVFKNPPPPYWADNYNVYFEAQADFRKGMGTTDNIFILHWLISHCIINNDKLFAPFVDFQKAFDYIVHDIL